MPFPKENYYFKYGGYLIVVAHVAVDCKKSLLTFALVCQEMSMTQKCYTCMHDISKFDCRVLNNVVAKKHFEIPNKDSNLQEIKIYKRSVAID
jgi:hypothetical protein